MKAREVIKDVLWKWLREGPYPPGQTGKMLQDKADAILAALKEAGYVVVDEVMFQHGLKCEADLDALQEEIVMTKEYAPLDERLVEKVARAQWEERRKFAATADFGLEEWGDGTVPKANNIMAEARAVIPIITRKVLLQLIDFEPKED